MSKFIIPIMLLSVTGCATTNSASLAGEKSMQDRFGSAFFSPLSDLNIVQTTIPLVIQEAIKNPYRIPADMSCKALAEQIRPLDVALGADLDAVIFQNEKTAVEKGQEFVQDEAVGSVERTISGFIPFRSWLRKLTGAERHSKDVTAAIAAGVVRRAFLKGIGQALGCGPPAAPIKPSPTAPSLPMPVREEPTKENTASNKVIFGSIYQ